MITLLLFSGLVSIVLAWFFGYFKYEKYLKSIKGPFQIPLFGSGLDIKSTTDFIPALLRYQESYGGIFKLKMGFANPTIFISDVKFLEYLLSSTKILQKSDEYRFLHSWLGTGLVTSAGVKWKTHRKIITPAFHFQILEQFIDVFDPFSNILVDKLAAEVEKDSIDICPYVTLCSLDIICAAAMGTTVDAQNNCESEYVNSVKDMCKIVVERALSVVNMYDVLYYFSKDYKKEEKALKVLHQYTYDVINSRKKELFDSEADLSDVDEFGRKKRKPFLDTLLQHQHNDKQSLTDEEIREEVDTFIFEGHDTTSSAMSFVFYCLSLHHEVQEKVMEELRNIFDDDKTRPATHNDLQEMKYLEAVIKETLRLYPTVPMYGRNLDTDIEFDGVIFPKNTTLQIFAFGIHRDPTIYPDPERFDPERFLSNIRTRSPYAYIPFSAGARNCIGQKFAILEMKSVVSKVLRNYELLPSIPEHKVVLLPETILKSKTGLCMRLRKRNF